jgi:hypothetical protein
VYQDNRKIMLSEGMQALIDGPGQVVEAEFNVEDTEV